MAFTGDVYFENCLIISNTKENTNPLKTKDFNQRKNTAFIQPLSDLMTTEIVMQFF